MNNIEINKYIDHTLLKATATEADIKKLCDEAIEYKFKSVCINPYYVSLASKSLKDTDVKVCTVVGFPLGASNLVTKSFETRFAIMEGASEIDMVINVGALKDKRYDLVKAEIEEVVCEANDLIVKVILETCYLTDEEIIKACKLAEEAGARFVKTSTGFGTGGATIEHVKLMRDTVSSKVEVKASGGVRTYSDAMKMIEAGATRIGTSNGIDIVRGKNEESNN